MEQSLSALVYGKEYNTLAEDLFIPDNALEVFLESFSGPLDLLLYLIRKKNIDILDIPITLITKQYLVYIDFLFKEANPKFELASDYLLMASVLAQIKSKLLLPKTPSPEEEEEEDPRMDLVKRLQAYEEIKEAAMMLDELPRWERDNFLVEARLSDVTKPKNYPHLTSADLFQAMKFLIELEDNFLHHEISREPLSVKERMSKILVQLQAGEGKELAEFYSLEEGRAGLVVSLLAILELARLELVIITQTEAFSRVYIRRLPDG